MAYLYINEPGTVLGFSENCFTVSYRDGLLRKIPSETLESVSLFGTVQVTPKCMAQCLKRGIGINYYSGTGSYFGRVISTNHVNVFRHRQQVRLTEDEGFRLELSKKMIRAKLNNQAVVLRRYQKSSGISVLNEINEISLYERKAENCGSAEQLMGYEGSAAKAYFRGLAAVVEESFRFQGRNRRPPRDPFNSMLSLGYSILLNEVYGEIEHRGLNPYFGFLHRVRENHPALASDLMEEWRPVVVDSVVMSMVNGHEIFTSNFHSRKDRPGFFLDKEGMKKFISKLEKKFSASTKYLSYADYPVSFRRAIGMQAGSLAKALETADASHYIPVRIR